MPDAHKNLAVSTIAVAPSPAASGTSFTVQAGHGARFPAEVPFSVTVWPGGIADPSNAEICRVTALAGDVFTVTRADEGTSARAILVGDLVVATITVRTLLDVENVLREVDLPVAGMDVGLMAGTYDTPPLFVRRASSAGQPAGLPPPVDTVAYFTASPERFGQWSWTLPPDYVGGGSLLVKFSMATATAGNIGLRAGVACVPSASVQGAAVFAAADAMDVAVPGTLGHAVEASLPLTMTGAQAGRKLIVALGLVAASASNATGDRILERVRFRYTARVVPSW